MSEEEIERRKKGVNYLCQVIGVAPMYICDEFLTLWCGEPSVDPSKIEEVLRRKGVYRENIESVGMCLRRLYGKKIAALAYSLI